MKQYHKGKFAGFSFGVDQLDTFFFEELTMSHGQAAVERGFSVNKDVLAPNLKAVSLTALCLIHDTISEGQIEIGDYIITDELLTSCSHASNNRYRMYLMERQKEDQESEKIRKRKALQEELIAAKKRKTELQATAQKLVDSADMKAKEAEKRTDVATLKALLIKSPMHHKKDLKRS